MAAGLVPGREPTRRQCNGVGHFEREDRAETAGAASRANPFGAYSSPFWPIPPTHVLTELLSRDAQAGARALGLQLHVLHLACSPCNAAKWCPQSRHRCEAVLVIGSDQFFNSRSAQIAGPSVSQHSVATVYQYREFIAAGGLASYGASLTEACATAGTYTGRILNGEKPSDLPVAAVHEGGADH